jgi:hypothetical protein
MAGFESPIITAALSYMQREFIQNSIYAPATGSSNVELEASESDPVVLASRLTGHAGHYIHFGAFRPRHRGTT